MIEKRLIDANKLEKLVVKHSAAYSHKDDILAAIAAQPTVDAVEVVRCKDCKNYVKMSEQDKEFRCNVFCGCYDRPYPTGPNDFCSYGERNNDNEKT